MVPLDKKTGKPTGRPILIAGGNGAAIEAPFIIRKGRHYFLFVSFDQCCQGVDSTYKIMVGRSPNVTGPYVDFNGQRLTDGGGTLVLAGYGRFCGPATMPCCGKGITITWFIISPIETPVDATRFRFDPSSGAKMAGLWLVKLVQAQGRKRFRYPA